MTLLNTLVVLISFLSLFNYYCKRNKIVELVFFWVFLIWAFFIAGFNKTSPDYLNYIDIFKSLGTYWGDSNFTPISGDKTYSPLFVFIVKVCNSIYNNPLLPFLVIALISVSMNFYIFKKYSKYLFVSILIYIVHSYVNKDLIQIRSGLASAFVLFSFSFYFKDKMKCLLFLILASFCHKSALVALIPFFYCFFIKVDNVKKEFLILFSISILLYLSTSLSYIGDIINSLSFVSDTEKSYIYNPEYNESLSLLNPTTIKYFLACLLCLFFLERDIKQSEYIRVLYVYLLFSLCWILSFSNFSILASRVSSITSVSEFIILPYILFRLKIKPNIGGVLIVLYCLFIYSVNIYHKYLLSSLSF